MASPASREMLKDYLSTLVYFEELPSDDIEFVTERTMRYIYEANETIFFEGDPASGLWIVESGRIKVFKISAEGSEHILHILGPGDTFNDIATLDNGPNPADAAALSDAAVWLIPTEIFTQLIARNTDFALRVVRVLAKRVRTLVGNIEDLALHTVIVRLARFLLEQIEDPSLSGPGVTRTAIAAHLATTPQTISNVLRELETAGAIEFDRHRIWIVDEDLLRNIALR